MLSLLRVGLLYLCLHGTAALFAQYTPASGTVTACSGTFTDSGGPNGGYSYYSSGTPVTFQPASAGEKTSLLFSTIALGDASPYGGQDELRIYDGTSTSAPLAATFTGNHTNVAVTATNAAGALTAVLQYNGAGGPGWEATLSCLAGVQAATAIVSQPGGCAGETVQLSLSGTYAGNLQWQRSADQLNWTDLTGATTATHALQATATAHYRCRFADANTTLYSNVVSYAITCADLTQAATATLCGATFHDWGGPTNPYTNASSTESITLYPVDTAAYLSLHFQSVGLAVSSPSYGDDALHLYAGTDNTAPLLGTLTDTATLRSFSAAAPGAPLTVIFTPGYYGTSAPGWLADVQCLTAPQAATAVLDGPAARCVGETFAFYLSGPYTGLLQWQHSTDQQSWTDLPGAAAPMYAHTAERSGYLRCAFSAGGQTLYSNAHYLDVSCVRMGAAPQVNSCGLQFTDAAGPADYSGAGTQQLTIYPTDPADRLSIDLASMQLEADGYYGSTDVLNFYEGPGTAAADLLVQHTDTLTNRTVTARDAGSPITVQFVSQHNSHTGAGWDAAITCRRELLAARAVLEKPASCAGETNRLYLYGPHCGSIQWQYSTDRTSWKSLAGATASVHDFAIEAERYYRCRFSLGGQVVYSNVVRQELDCILHGVTATVQTDTAVYTDNGGAAGDHNFATGNQQLTFLPARAGERVRLSFTQLAIGNHTLRIHDGASTGSPVLGDYSSNPGTVEATSLSGALTVVYVHNYANGNTNVVNWAATVGTATGNLVRLPLRVVLQGACDVTTGAMHDSLRLNALLPPEQPYAAAAGASYNGCEAVPDLTVLGAKGLASVVDWVVVELRAANDPTQVVTTAAALLLRNGAVKAPDGYGDVALLTPPGNYYVAVRHRNHLPAMTAAPVPLAFSSAPLDFSDPNLATYGTHARHLSNGVACLWAGDADGDGRIALTGTDPDTNPVTGEVLNATANPAGLSGYLLVGYRRTDLNLSGGTQATLQTPDVQLIQQNVLTHPANVAASPSFVIRAQLPE